AKEDYAWLENILKEQDGVTTYETRKQAAAKAFHIVMNYDIAINNWWNGQVYPTLANQQVLRYGENPHQEGVFYGDLNEIFDKLNGKELSYNNLVDTDAAVQLIEEFAVQEEAVFAIIKHTNVCGIAQRVTLAEAWDAALAGDPESAFGGVLATNKEIDATTAQKINELFFEILVAPSFSEEALTILKSKKNRILLAQKAPATAKTVFKNVLNGTLTQAADTTNYEKWDEVGAQPTTEAQKADL